MFLRIHCPGDDTTFAARELGFVDARGEVARVYVVGPRGQEVLTTDVYQPTDGLTEFTGSAASIDSLARDLAQWMAILAPCYLATAASPSTSTSRAAPATVFTPGSTLVVSIVA